MDVTEHIEWLKGIWGDADLLDGVRIEVSRRMTRSVGRCYAQRGVIRISERVLRAAAAEGGGGAGEHDVLGEVLVHELAHLVVFRRHGRAARPHGREWRELMVLAGYPPRTHLPVGSLPSSGGRRRQAAAPAESVLSAATRAVRAAVSGAGGAARRGIRGRGRIVPIL